VDIVATETLIDRALLNAVSDVFLCDPPTDRVKAEVVTLLMTNETSAHASLCLQSTRTYLRPKCYKSMMPTGFGLVPERIKKLLRKPLVTAAPEESQETVFERSRFTQSQLGETDYA